MERCAPPVLLVFSVTIAVPFTRTKFLVLICARMVSFETERKGLREYSDRSRTSG